MSPSLKLSGSWYRLGCDYFAAWWKIAGNDKPRALRNDHARDITHGLLRFTDYFRTVHRNHQASASLRFTSPARARARRGRGGTRGGNGEEKRVKWTTDRVHLFTSDRYDINRYLSMKRLTIRILGIPSNLPRGYHRVLSDTPPRVLLSRDYTHDSHFRPSSAARTDVLGDTVSVVRHLEWGLGTKPGSFASQIGSEYRHLPPSAFQEGLRWEERPFWSTNDGSAQVALQNQPAFYLRLTCVTVTLLCALTWRGPGTIVYDDIRPYVLRIHSFPFFSLKNRNKNFYALKSCS